MKLRGLIGNYLEQLLLDRKMHQRDLAERAGVSCAYISAVMRGERNLGPDSIPKVCAALESSKKLQIPIYYRLHYLAAMNHGFDVDEHAPSAVSKAQET